MRWIAIASMMTGAWLSSANSSEPQPAMTAEDLQQLCAGEDHVSRNACRIYILGVTQGISVGIRIATGQAKPGVACVPQDISAEKLEQSVKARLREDLSKTPADRGREASAFIGAVLAAEFPCTKHP
jgi:hypothetical protein